MMRNVVTCLLGLAPACYAGMLDNAGFNRGNWTTFEDPPGAWVSIAPNGTLVPSGGIDSENYGQSHQSTPATPGLTSIAAHFKAAGGNALRQTLHHVDAGTFAQYEIDFLAGYRRDTATAGDLTLRVSLLDPIDGTVFTFQDLLFPDPGVGPNSLTPRNLTLTVDTAILTGRPIAIQFANLSATPSIWDSWSGTLMIDDIEVNPVTSPVAAPAFTTTTVRDLINRLLPGRQGEFSFEIIPPDAGRDVFEIEAGPSGTIIIRGNRTLSLTSGFHWYLKHVAGCHVSWNGTQLN
ncbi:MAG: alpha-N-acetylglucosaminidase N-terminal domain-containing protein, partial [Verrucomicrobiae bacterium]|nr:alpha-N-acetylglucosaminidase N-terminal domain-containing protein [Verrucomicrobiae bacterium]